MKGKKRRIKILTLSTLVFAGIFLIASEAFTRGPFSPYGVNRPDTTRNTSRVGGVVRDRQEQAKFKVQSNGPEAKVEIDNEGNVLINGEKIGLKVAPGTKPEDITVSQNEDGSYTVSVPQGNREVKVKVKQGNVTKVRGVKIPDSSKVNVKDGSVEISDVSGDHNIVMKEDADGNITVDTNGKSINVTEGSEILFGDFSDENIIIKKGKNEVIVGKQGKVKFKNDGKIVNVEKVPDDAEITVKKNDNVTITSGNTNITVDKDGKVKLFEGEKSVQLSEDCKVTLKSDGNAVVKLGDIMTTYASDGKVTSVKVKGENISVPEDTDISYNSKNMVIDTGDTKLTYNKYGTVEELKVNGQTVDISPSITHFGNSKVEFDEEGNVVIKPKDKNSIKIAKAGDTIDITINGQSATVPSGAEISDIRVTKDGSVNVTYNKDGKDYVLTVDNNGEATTEDQTSSDDGSDDSNSGNQDSQQDATSGSRQNRGCSPLKWNVSVAGQGFGFNFGN